MHTRTKSRLKRVQATIVLYLAVRSKLSPVFILVSALCTLPCVAYAQTRVVTTNPGLADIAAQIGREHVQVHSIMRGGENPHHVIAKPSHMIKLRSADLFVHTGLDAEPWVPLLIKGSRQPRFMPGQSGNVDVSINIQFKEVPQRGQLTRASGDIHAFGNTHYSLDPLNGIVIARTISDALTRHDPNHADVFEQRYTAFADRMQKLTQRLVTLMEPYRDTPVVVYHRAWPYFLDRFGLKKVAEVEPKPGIAPGPGHLKRCIETIRQHNAKVIIVETYSNADNAEFIANRTNAAVAILAQEVGAIGEVDRYAALFEYNIERLVAALEQTRTP